MNPGSPESSDKPPTWALVLAFALIYLSWGTTYLAIQKGVRDEKLPPALFGGTRVWLAGVLLLGYLAVRRQPLGMSRRDWAGVFLTGPILFVAGNGLMNVAEETVPSGVAAVLAATTPLWIGLVEMFWPAGERLNARGWLGLIAGLAGVMLLFLNHLQDLETVWTNAGPFLALGSAASWAFGSVMLRHRRMGCSHLAAAAYQMMVGGGALALLGLAVGETERLPSQVTAGALASFFYLLIVGSLVGFVAFNFLLGHVSAAKVGTYAYVNPVVAVFIGWLNGEPFTIWLVAGISIILAGVGLVRSGEKEKTPIK